MKNLNKPFKHKTWYVNSNLTVREFLELAAESHNFHVEKKAKYTDNLLEEPSMTCMLTTEEGRGSYKLTAEELNIFNTRRDFWRKWENDFDNQHLKPSENFNYISFVRLKETEKNEIPEYKQAHDKLITQQQEDHLQ